jgi:hypothetical protein
VVLNTRGILKSLEGRHWCLTADGALRALNLEVDGLFEGALGAHCPLVRCSCRRLHGVQVATLRSLLLSISLHILAVVQTLTSRIAVKHHERLLLSSLVLIS